MIREFGLNKNLNIKAYKKYGLNLKSRFVILNTKQKKQFENFFKTKDFGKILKQKVKSKIDFIIKNKTFKGLRHKQKYPARGQRTHTNAKTKKKIKLY